MTTLAAPSASSSTTLVSGAIAFVAAMGCSILLVAWLPGQWLRDTAVEIDAALPLALQPRAAADSDAIAPAKTRCTSCGVVEDIRHIEAAEGMPAMVEFTVRMADGSVRLSRNESAFSWRHGDRIMLIGGVAMPPKPAGN